MKIKNLEPDFTSEIEIHRKFLSALAIGSFRNKLPQYAKFSELARPYQPSDPVKWIDWKVYAKNQELIVRQKIEASHITVNILLDVSETMKWPETNSKKETAFRVACHLAYSHILVGDEVKLFFCDFEKNKYRSWQLKKLSEVLEIFNETRSIEGQSFEENINFSYYSYLLSDGINSVEEIQKYNSLNFIQILSSQECNLSWLKQDMLYFDEKSVKEKNYHGKYLLDKNYLSNKILDWQKSVQNKVEQNKNGKFLFLHEEMNLEDYFLMLENLWNELR